jgi:hypothetical protein
MLNLGVENKKKKFVCRISSLLGISSNLVEFFCFFEAEALDDISGLNPCNGWKTMNFLLVSHPSKPIIHQISATPWNIFQSRYRKPFSHSPECEGKNCTLGELALTTVPLGKPKSYFCVR